MTLIYSNEEVHDYFEESTILYNLFAVNSLHYGHWDPEIRTQAEAHQNTNKFMAENLSFDKNDILLDAGCGVGGTAIYVGQNYGAKVHGVTLSEYQVRVATKNSEKLGLDELLEFHQMNFKETSFEDEFFTKIYAMESLCHESDRLSFLKEAIRVLQPGGKIAVLDVFLLKDENKRNEKEEKDYQAFLEGWRMSDFNTLDGFRKLIEEAGFENIEFIERIDQVYKSAEGIYRTGILSYPLTWVLDKLNWVPENIHGTTVGCVVQKYLIDDGVCTYGLFIANKPEY